MTDVLLPNGIEVSCDSLSFDKRVSAAALETALIARGIVPFPEPEWEILFISVTETSTDIWVLSTMSQQKRDDIAAEVANQ